MKSSANLNSFLRLLMVSTTLIGIQLQANAILVKIDDHGTGPDAAFVKSIDAILSDKGLRGGYQGVYIQSLADGKIWYERNSEVTFLPASNQKLLTSSAALALLGPKYTYETVLYRQGVLDNEGTLRGALYLKGAGDPLLMPADLDAMVESAKAAGIKKVMGKLYADDSKFDHKTWGYGWEWDDMPFYYSAPVGGLNLNENVVLVKVDPGKKPGDPLIISMTPFDKSIKIINRSKTFEKGQPSTINISRQLGQNVITIDGGFPMDPKPTDHRTEPITVESPTQFTASYLLEKFKSSGIDFTGDISEGLLPEKDITEIARHSSLPFSEVLKKLNKPSDNLVAECILKTLGAEKGKTHIGSTAEGRSVAMDWFKSVGVDVSGVRMQDGSGLSRQNYVSPRAYGQMLKAIASDPNAKIFIDSLPNAGVDGSLRNRLKGTVAENNVKAKTGSLANVSSLSGYVTTKAGEKLLFVIFLNNQPSSAVAHQVEDKIALLLAAYDGK